MKIVILAAGLARRMGRQKLLLPIDGLPMIVRVIDAASQWPILVVAGSEIATVLRDAPVDMIRNTEPERGMTRSLALANDAVPPDEPIAVLLGDLPDIDAATIARAIAAYDANVDVVIPRAGERFGHPVIFGPVARKKIAALPDGDSLRTLRDDPDLRRRFVDLATNAALADIDTPAEYEARSTRP
ncbi:MAG: hypothetical protein NVSMB5_08480 [Candidatus Velthaea sp.]